MDFVELRTFDNYIEADIVLKMLRFFNINCYLKDENIILRKMKLMVHHAHIERAWDMMEKAEQEYLKSVPCPVCKSHMMMKEVIMKKHSCKLGALASMLLNGHSVEVTQIYKCANCGYDFKELP